MSNQYLEDILSDRLASLIPENKDNSEETKRKIEKFKRNIEIFKSYHGIDGNGGSSMEKTGVKYALTRESVRQITDKLAFLLNTNKTPIPELDKAISMINSMVPAKNSRIESELSLSKLTKEGFMLEGVLNIAKIFKKQIKADKLIFANDTKFFVQKKFEGTPKSILSIATKHVSHNGAIPVSILLKEVSGINQKIKSLFVSDILDSVGTTVWLDDKWVHFGDKGLNRFSKRLEKLLSVYDNVNINTVHNVISRNWKKGHVDITSVLPKDIMIKFISSDSRYSLFNGFIKSTDSDLLPAYSPVEKEMISIINSTKNKEIREKELEDLVVEDDLTKKYAFSQALNFSVLFDRKKWGLYTISGDLK